jgi:hypothetical protein
MNEKDTILVDYGWCQVIKRTDHYILNYDSGGVVIKMAEIRVSEKEAMIAVANELEAEKIIKNKQK